MSETKILIVDDEPDIRNIISDILNDEGFTTFTAQNAETAREIYQRVSPDVVLLDIWMPDTDGISVLKGWMQEGTTASIIMISGHGTVDTAVEAIRIGAYDFLEKPLSTAKLLVTVERALQNRKLTEENLQLRNRLEPATDLLGDSPRMDLLREKIQRFAATDSWVVVQGEPGSGKGVVARSLHRQSRRAERPFVEVNLGAIPTENVAIHLFGHEQGDIIEGSLERANGGSLVLDEVADLDADLQAKLLSALEERSFFRVGGRTTVHIDIRVIATTNQDLQEMVSQGSFRRDLYDRLNQLPISVPPLREHSQDVPILVDSIANTAIDNEAYPQHQFSTAAMNILRSYRWPGNVRELYNVVRRLLITSEHTQISATDVRQELGGTQSDSTETTQVLEFEADMREARETFERAYLSYHLGQVNGNMTELATRTGLERTHLYRKLKGLGIDPKSGKRGTAA
jgi:two-component system, NtrC family, nitrogen regulation response regulator NtrX